MDYQANQQSKGVILGFTIHRLHPSPHVFYCLLLYHYPTELQLVNSLCCTKYSLTFSFQPSVFFNRIFTKTSLFYLNYSSCLTCGQLDKIIVGPGKTGAMNAIEQSPEQPPAPNALAHLTRAPIAQLSPDIEKLAEKSFLAAVALVWPYSSSTKSVSLLLAEPDFRLRGAKGQIKATFHGRVAEKVAESHIGIGDTVCLALKDVKFVSNDGVQQTPGRSVAWDAHWENSVFLEVCRFQTRYVCYSD